MVMDVRFAQVLMLGVFVGQMGVGYRCVIVLVRVESGEMLPFADKFVWPLPPVVRHMRMLVFVDDGLVAVLDVFGKVGALANLIEDAACGPQGPDS